MATAQRPWESRFARVYSIVLWLTLLFGVFLSFLTAAVAGSPRVILVTLVAAAAAGGYVIAVSVLYQQIVRRSWAVEVMGVSGVVLTMVAVGLTGAVESPYLLLSLVPVLAAAAFSTFRVGIETALFAAGTLVAVTLGAGQTDYVQLAGWAILYLLGAVAFDQARRILLEQHQRVEELALAGEADRLHVERLESANRLLSRLSELTDADELNPIAVGRTALESIDSSVQFDGGMVALSGDSGPVAVARRGIEGDFSARLELPLRVSGREVGMVVLGRGHAFQPDERETVEGMLQPVALAFSNVLLLQDIARRAVRQERARLARELHDEIGPSLASLGLALDLAMLQYPTEPALAGHLESLRTSVTSLVEEVRSTVADLREPVRESMVEFARDLAATVPDGVPSVELQIDERRPPRLSVMPDLSAIVAEAFRNAVRHSGANAVRIQGVIDFDRGVISVRDNGRGFDPNGVGRGHFGLIGMQERAEKIAARLTVDSAPGEGTIVRVEWQ